MPNQLKQRRKALALTQEEVARAAGTTKATIMKLEKGLMQLTESWMKRLAVPLQCQPADLLMEVSFSDVPLIGVVDKRDMLALYRPLPLNGVAEGQKYWEGLEMVERPPEAGHRNVIAVRVQGDAYGPLLPAGSLLYAADPITSGFEKYLNQIVLCRDTHGVLKLKKLEYADGYGMIRLSSVGKELSSEEEINWCAKVIFMKPA